MPMESLSVKKLKEVLRLRFEGQLKHRQIARALHISAAISATSLSCNAFLLFYSSFDTLLFSILSCVSGLV